MENFGYELPEPDWLRKQLNRENNRNNEPALKGTPNLRGCPPEKKFIRAPFLIKPPEKIYQ